MTTDLHGLLGLSDRDLPPADARDLAHFFARLALDLHPNDAKESATLAGHYANLILTRELDLKDARAAVYRFVDRLPPGCQADKHTIVALCDGLTASAADHLGSEFWADLEREQHHRKDRER